MSARPSSSSSQRNHSPSQTPSASRNEDLISQMSSDPLALSDADISPFRPLRPNSKAPRTGASAATLVSDEDDEEEGEIQYIPASRANRNVKSLLNMIENDVTRSRTTTPRNALAEPSRRAGQPPEEEPIFDPSLDELGSEPESELVLRPGPGKPLNRANYLRSLGTSSQLGRGIPVVEIPLLPFSQLRRYAVPFGFKLPTQGSRDLLRGLTPHPSSSTSPPMQSSRRAARPSWRVTSSLSFDEESEEDELGDYGSDESDDVMLRRSGRTMTKRSNGGREVQLISSRTRSKRYSSSQERSSISPITEDTFYGRSSPSTKRKHHHHNHRPPNSSRKMVRRSARLSCTPSVKSGRGNGRNSPNDSFEGEDELDTHEYLSASVPASEEEFEELEDDWSDDQRRKRSRKGKDKGKAKKGGSNHVKNEEEVDESLLHNHRSFCEKCSREPADEIQDKAVARKSNGKGRKKKRDDDEISDEELAHKLEGWLECTRCVVASHWGCLASTQKAAVLDMLKSREGPTSEGKRPRRSVEIDETSIFTCIRCEAEDKCFVCHEETVLKSIASEAMMEVNAKAEDCPVKDEQMEVDGQSAEVVAAVSASKVKKEKKKALLFRCLRCKQAAHYEHLEADGSLGIDPSPARIAVHYQTHSSEGQAWICHQCRSWIWTVDLILAWRPSPVNAKEPRLEPDEFANWKDRLPREYLVKWLNRGFRHLTWAPHAWLQVIAPARLRNFLVKGPSLDLVTDASLAAKGDEMAEPTIARVLEEDDRVTGGRAEAHHHSQHDAEAAGEEEWVGSGPGPDKDAQAGIPILWSTADRVLDIMLLPPSKHIKKKPQPAQRRGQRILSVSVTPSESSRRASPGEAKATTPAIASAPAVGVRDDSRAILGLKDGLQPPGEMMADIDEWEGRTGRKLGPENVDEVADLVTWCFIKWEDLQYDQSCWDTPPPINSALYPAFKRALERYLRARQIKVPVLSAAQCKRRDREAEKLYVPPEDQPECISGGKLMPFQMEGFQWLLYNHFKRHSCILADDMGLGKTVQIASFLGYLGSDKHSIYPSLVIVPNSTITNWVREFEKWVPHMRVVPYYGDSPSRKIISKYELYHKGLQGKAEGLKAHVVLTTYDMITGSEFRVFKSIPRWEVLCVDEGQRLKSDNSLIFNRLKTLNSVHRILLTGTPLNNNLRELFNLLNFLDPTTFRELEDLEKRFENLNEGLIQELHEMIKPYILRRIKADVLKLPPKVEIIVPISLTPLQKQVYKGIFERNADLIQAIYQARQKKAKALAR